MKNVGNNLNNLIATRQANVCIIGLGHVGLPEAVAFAKSGFNVVGYDINQSKVDAINSGRSHLVDVRSRELHELINSRRFRADTAPKALDWAHVMIIAVPTLLTKHKNPDVRAVRRICAELSRHVKEPKLIILESTGPPGVTEEIVKTALEAEGLTADEDFFLACSPARIDPANKDWPLVSIPKIVGGLTPKSTDMAASLYGQVMRTVVRASSLKAAEMTKLMENSFRAVNIAFVDQMHMICHEMGLDIWEIIELAATKPFGFVPFYPGPGPGGECIPVDPFYVAWKAREYDLRAHFIELAGETMDTIPDFFIHTLADLLSEAGKPLKGAKVLLLGVSYKKNVADVSRSPAYALVKILREHGTEVVYSDPYVPEFKADGERMRSVSLSGKALHRQDAVIIVTDHSNVDYDLIVDNSPLILDTRNALADYESATIHR